ncbi:MAG: DUF1080 domain-containing protein [Candidatus Hinthialibacter antarcticus]|nr:DUF1080 domain-containing protein [Candidatus Hinthialibacter antarcticus]
MNAKRKLIVPVCFCIFMAGWIALSFTCCTTAVQNRDFEEAIEAFVKHAQPGSSIALFNGRDLSGWRAHGPGRWRVKDGVLSVTGGMGYLATAYDEFTDIIFSLDVRVSDGGNSGVFFRAQHPGFGLRPWPRGYEAQVDNNGAKNPTGSLYNITKADKVLTQDGEWFSMEVRCIDDQQTIFVNGELVAQTRDSSYHRGFIALQGHHPSCTVEFKNIDLTLL